MFANHHRLKGKCLDLRLAETRRIYVSQEGGMNPWEPGQSQVSRSMPHPLLEVQKNLTQTQQSCAALSKTPLVLYTIVSVCHLLPAHFWKILVYGSQ